MISRERDRTVTFECDNCGEGENTAEEDFRDALNEIKRMDWAVRLLGTTWTHTCPDCLAEETEGAFQ
jgi:predicted RNA-binding Zn-ribbon protein involved in translation (DUF1610 family)